MSKNRKINYNRRGRSFFNSIWEFITGILRYRIQWKRLEKRRVTPNYYYLTSSSHDQVIPTDFCKTITAKHQDPVKSVAEQNVEQQKEAMVSAPTHIEEQPAASGQHVVNGIQEPANNDQYELIVQNSVGTVHGYVQPSEEAVVVDIPNMTTALQDEQSIKKPATKKTRKNTRNQIPLPFD